MKQSALALKSHRVIVRMIGLMLANIRRLANIMQLLDAELGGGVGSIMRT